MIKVLSRVKPSIKKINITTEATVMLAYVGLFITFSIIAPYFTTLNNLMNVLLYSSVLGITATGMTMVIISGGLDISVGSIIGLAGMAAGIVMSIDGSVTAAIIAALLVGAGCGAINGFLITKFKVNPLIATLATMSIFRGIARLTTNGMSLMISQEGFNWLGRGYFIDVIPVSVVTMLLMFISIGYLLKYTPFGRKAYSTGGNSEASRLSGINVNVIRFLIYVICGLLAGLSGIVTASQTGASLPNAGMGAELDIIGAVILGGTSLKGGKGNIFGTLMGVLILATLSNGLTLMNIMSFWQMIAKGTVLIVAVVLDVARGGGYE